MNLIAFPGVQRSAEDGFTSVRTFFSCNLQYTYLNFPSAEFSPKKHYFCCIDCQILIQSDQFFGNSHLDFQNPQTGFMVSVKVVCLSADFYY